MAHRFLHESLTRSVLREQEAAYGRSRPVPPAPGLDELGAEESSFIERRDSFCMATVSEAGWPYVQHRGGVRGFLKVLDPRTLAFADLSGNRQLLSTGNLRTDDRVSLFLMDYPRRERLKIMGHASILPVAENKALAAELLPEGASERLAERLFRIRVVGYDWNCPKYITPRFTLEEVEKMAAPMKKRVAELEALLAERDRPRV